MKLFSIALAPVAMALLSSCAALTGNAHYTYHHVTKAGDACDLDVDSGRVLRNGVEAEIDSDCKVTVKAASVEQGGSSIKDVTALVEKVGAIATAAAASGQ